MDFRVIQIDRINEVACNPKIHCSRVILNMRS